MEYFNAATVFCFFLFLLLQVSFLDLAHAANNYTKGQQCTFREDVGKGSPPKYNVIEGKSGKPVEKLVSEWKQGDQIVPLLKPGDLMELKHTEGTHWMIYVGGPRLEYIHTSHKSQPSINWTSVQKSSLLTSCQRWMIRKNNHLDSKYKHYSPSQVVQRAEALVGCTRIPFSYSHNNCQHFVNSVRYDIWQSEIADNRNSCHRNTLPWRKVIEDRLPSPRNDTVPFYKIAKASKSGKQVVVNIKLYGNLPEEIHSAYWPLVRLVRRKTSKNGSFERVKTKLKISKKAKKGISELLKFVKKMTLEYHTKMNLLKNLTKEKERDVLKILVLREWNALVKEVYSKVLSRFPDGSGTPVNNSDGGAVECYRDWDLGYVDKSLKKLIGYYVKSKHTLQFLTSEKNMIQYKIA